MTTRSTLIERLRNLDLTTPVKVFFRDIIDNLQTSEDVTANNYTTLAGVDADGYIKIDDVNSHLAVSGWDDLRFPAQGINPPGAASDPDVDTTDGCLLFDAGSTEVIVGIAQMPHSWIAGSTISPHIHWSPTNTNTGNVYWRFEYEVKPIGSTFTGYTTLNTLDAADGTANKHQIHELGDIALTGITGVSAIMKWKISRIGGDATDTYNADAKLLEFDIHYQINRFGSPNEYGP